MILLPDKEELPLRGLFPIPVVAGMSHLQPHVLFPLVTALLGCSSESMGVAQRTGHTAGYTPEAGQRRQDPLIRGGEFSRRQGGFGFFPKEPTC